MSPSRRHGGYEKRIARLIELYALERGVPLSGYGSTTFRAAVAERGLEPDECYVLGAAGYERRPRSELVPGLDFEGLAPFAEGPNQLDALQRYQRQLRQPD